MEVESRTRYGRLRYARGEVHALQEEGEIPPETLLQAIWQHQRLHRHKLTTVDGHRVFILHPGFLNRESGPDFRQAVVQVGNGPVQRGDVEVDPLPSDWFRHRHEGNPAYENVRLHVVWQRDPGSRDTPGIPLLELHPWLDTSLSALSLQLGHDDLPGLPPHVAGKCSGPLKQTEPQQLENLLQEAALFRLHSRADEIATRARGCGWDQAMWERTFRALGYKNNRWPMLRLAEIRKRLQSNADSRTVLVARLLGTAGLLPAEPPGRDPVTKRYHRTLWDSWWRDRDVFMDCTLPSSVWSLAGIRPSNHPQRRLVLAADWLLQNDLPARLGSWCTSTFRDGDLPRSLLRLLNPRPDAFWERHYTLRSPCSEMRIPLLGSDRVTDLAANAILPWLWARARAGGRTRLCRELERRYQVWPAASDNASLKLARQRLFGGRKTNLPRRVAIQQGILQIVGDYCNHANSLCDGCEFPQVARRFAGPGS